ncbi:unnamed protein product [Moneuplotes crassus]|uniref:Uncharacterized protein n=1 Tax=Euplotes crassus TaxID=5936 RepID=A0AAD1UB94_EUPCR|nr:unnamed protein product [Moneuplotes crassus]
MGNNIASEGEDMADSPRAGTGELLTSKKKHRSHRRKMADKLKKSNLKKGYKEDQDRLVIQEVPSKPAAEGFNARRNYYKNLGINHIGSGEGAKYAPHNRMMTSTISGLPGKGDPKKDKEHASSYSYKAMSKAKDKARNDVKQESKMPENEGGFGDFLQDQEEVKEVKSSELDKEKENNEESKKTRNTAPDFKHNLKELISESKDDSTATEDASITEADKEDQDFKLDFITKNQERSGDAMRRKFLSRLTQEKVWLTPSEKPKAHQTCIIFDWDDTLLCTTFLNPTNCGNFDLPLNVKVQMKRLEKACINILGECMNYGDVYIITNAAEGWVEYSARKYLPKLVPHLEKITIMSARAICEDEYPTDINQWKMTAFLKTQEKMEKGAITNLVALGDSQFEMDAVKNLGTKFSRALIKTVKFREAPTPDELVKQINLVLMKLDQICTSAKNLTIRLERKES